MNIQSLNHRLGLCLGLMLFAMLSRADAARPEIYGFSPAYPVALPDTSLSKPVGMYQFPWESSIVFDIDSNGQVVGIDADSTLDSAAFAPIRDRLAALRFHPGIVDSQPRAQKLAAQVFRYPLADYFAVRFPLDTAGNLVDQDLYMATVRANGIAPAAITRFSSFYSIFYRGDTLTMYPYILLRIRLDSLGRVRDIDTVRSTHPAFTQQIVSASNWAKFSPARNNGKAMPSVNWLLVSFFPLGRYPTKVVTSKNVRSLPLLEQLTLRLYADTSGLLSPPVPRGINQLQVTVPNLSKGEHGTAQVEISIDTLGSAFLKRAGERRTALLRDVRETLRLLRFYPAIDFAGHKREFSGFATFHFDGSTVIRIELHWLPDAPSPVKKVTTK